MKKGITSIEGMKNVFRASAAFTVMSIALGCSDFLDPLPNGLYNEENYSDYPTIIRGYVDKGYNLLPYSWYSNEFMGTDAAADNLIYRESSNPFRLFATGSAQPTSHPLSSVWTRDYEGIYYANLFLKDDIGYNTRYYVNTEADKMLRKALKGDAFALRAWFHYDLLKTFAGRSTSGELLGVPIMTEPVEFDRIEPDEVKRATFDDCVKQILEDCDSAYKYLPYANKDFLTDVKQDIKVLGGIRNGNFDQISIKMLKAMTYLLWASPAFNPYDDISRYDKAARLAAEIIDYKLNIESKGSHFNPTDRFLWSNCNGPEGILPSRSVNNSTYETNFYPEMFGGNANICPTQDLVDAYPMENGYPIDHPSSGYNPQNPYAHRDRRLYADIFHHGALVVVSETAPASYIFNTVSGEKDAPGGAKTSPTGYYVKKFIYNRWNPNDEKKETAAHCIFFMRWEQLCLLFAEAANNTVGPLDETTYGLSAKKAVGWLRSRNTSDGRAGISSASDKYLDECALAGTEVFNELIKNEYRIATCFEGRRFFDLRRWNTDLSELNKPVHKMIITANPDNTLHFSVEEAEPRAYPSLWLPIPYEEMRKGFGMFQNEGWESWK